MDLTDQDQRRDAWHRAEQDHNSVNISKSQLLCQNPGPRNRNFVLIAAVAVHGNSHAYITGVSSRDGGSLTMSYYAYVRVRIICNLHIHITQSGTEWSWLCKESKAVDNGNH